VLHHEPWWSRGEAGELPEAYAAVDASLQRSCAASRAAGGESTPRTVTGTPPTSGALPCSFDSSRSRHASASTSAPLHGSSQGLGLSMGRLCTTGSQPGSAQRLTGGHSSGGGGDGGRDASSSGGRLAAGSCPVPSIPPLLLTTSDGGTPTQRSGAEGKGGALAHPAVQQPVGCVGSTGLAAAASQQTLSVATTAPADGRAVCSQPAAPPLPLPSGLHAAPDCEMAEAEMSVPTTVVVTALASDVVMTEVVGSAEATATEDASTGNMPATEPDADAAMVPAAAGAAAVAADARTCIQSAAAGAGDDVDACTAPERDSPGAAAAAAAEAAATAAAAAMVAGGAATGRCEISTAAAAPQDLTLDLSSDEEVMTVYGVVSGPYTARAAGLWLSPLIADVRRPVLVRMRA
jgi:hypothetical protein